MIHASKIPVIMDRTNENGKTKTFDLAFRKQSTGELVIAKNVYMSSHFHRNGTINITFPNNQVRKIRMCLIEEINGKEVYL